MRFFKGLLFLFFCQLSHADIYQWVDENGKRHFSDRKPVDYKHATKINLKINSYKEISYEDYPSSIKTNDADAKSIVMYSASWCGYCRKAREYFRKNNIQFVEYDVEKSSKGKADYQKLKATGVPVILIGDKRMNGFSENRFEQLYNS